MPIRRISLAALLLLAALAALAQRTPGPTPLPRPTPRPLPTPAPTPLISRPERWPMPRPTEAGPLGRLNTPDEQKRLRLTDAVWQGAQGQVAALLEVGADPNVGAAEAGFPLMLAAYRGDIALATLLLDKGAVPVMPQGGSEDHSALHIAAARGHLAMVRLLLARGVPVETRIGLSRCTPLHVAAAYGHLLVVEALLEAGAAPTTPDADGRTALHMAAALGDASIVERLLRAGVPVDARTDDTTGTPPGATPLACAMAMPQTGVTPTYRENPQGWANLGAARFLWLIELRLTSAFKRLPATPAAPAARDRHAVVLALRRAGADIRAIDAQGGTLLPGAVGWGETELVADLLAAGTRPDARVPILGFTALHVAPTPELATRLLDAGADINALMPSGVTPLMQALATDRIDVARLLIQRGARVDRVAPGHGTALHLAAASATPDLLAALLAAGADPRARDSMGRTPLLRALGARALDNARALLPVSDLTGVAGNDGDTPLHAAARLAAPDLVQAILATKPPVNAVNRTGATPLHLACRSFATELAAREMSWTTAEADTAGRAALRTDVEAVIALLLAAGADAGAVDAQWRTPLHDAPSKGAVEALLAKGARVDAAAGTLTGPRDRPLEAITDGDAARALIAAGARRLQRDRSETLATLAKKAPARIEVLIALETVDTPNARPPLPLATALLCREAARGAVGHLRALVAAGYDPSGVPGDDTPLNAAIRAGKLDAAAALLDLGAKPDGPGSNNETPLSVAIARADLPAVNLLLQRGASPTARGPKAAPPLFLAVQARAPEIVQALRAAGADPMALSGSNETLLHVAAAAGDLDAAAWALECKIALDAGDTTRRTALHVVDTPEAATALLAAGAPLETEDANGDTPLLAAMRRDNPGVTKVLLAAGANSARALALTYLPTMEGLAPQLLAARAGVDGAKPDATGPFATALLYSSFRAATAMLPYADLKGERGKAVLNDHVTGCRPEAVRLVLKAGADPNYIVGEQQSLLMSVINRAHFDLARVLIEGGARGDLAGPNGRTALSNAAYYARLDLLRLMLDHGTPVNAVMSGGRTALMFAAEHGGRDGEQTVKFLLERGADVTTKDEKGMTALHHAAKEGDALAVKAIITAGGDVKATDNEGRQPLHCVAIGIRDPKSVETLLAAGADLNAQDKNGYTPLMCQIAWGGNGTTLEHILDAKPDFSLKSNDGLTALAMAYDKDARGYLAAYLIAHGALAGGPVMIKEALIKAMDQPAAVERLLKAGAMLEDRDLEGRTALLWGVYQNYDASCRLLIAKGANVLATDNKGNTVLHMAAMGRNNFMLVELLDAGAPVNARNKDGKTALGIAEEKRYTGIAEVLRARGGVL